MQRIIDLTDDLNDVDNHYEEKVNKRQRHDIAQPERLYISPCPPQTHTNTQQELSTKYNSIQFQRAVTSGIIQCNGSTT